MGYLTTITIYNDGCHDIPTHAKEFADKVYNACCNTRKSESFGLGSYANLVTCQKSRHADDHTFYAHAGNTVIELNYFSQETIDTMKKNPEFFKKILDSMEYHVRELKKEYNNTYNQKTNTMNWKVEKLQKGETFITSEKGNSMTPIIKSGQDHKLAPVKLEDVKVGDIVFCKVNGRYYTHLVKGTSNRGLLIGNNKGGINGWTKQVFGKVIEIL